MQVSTSPTTSSVGNGKNRNEIVVYFQYLTKMTKPFYILKKWNLLRFFVLFNLRSIKLQISEYQVNQFPYFATLLARRQTRACRCRRCRCGSSGRQSPRPGTGPEYPVPTPWFRGWLYCDFSECRSGQKNYHAKKMCRLPFLRTRDRKNRF